MARSPNHVRNNTIMNIRRLLDDAVTQALQQAGAPASVNAQIQPAARPEFGDYQANGVMAVAKALRMPPRTLAQNTLPHIHLAEVVEKLEIAGPGFINITLSNAWIGRTLTQHLRDPRLGVERVGAPQNIVVDYSAPNLAKEMHVGHLRSTIIGDAVVRVLEFLGHRVVRQNHVGDWGTQFGMLIAFMEQSMDRHTAAPSHVLLTDLEEFYRNAKKRFDSDPQFADKAREYVVRLQRGDPHCLRLWQSYIEMSLKHCEEVYERLDVTLKHKDIKPESAYNADLPQVIADLNQLGMLTASEGAQCVFLDEFKGKDNESLPVIVQKSDGGYLYATTDLAALRYRARALHAQRVLYFVDARQSLHLKQVFAVARKAGFVPADMSLEHLPFGTMMGEDGKPFKTRTGGTVKLMDLLQEAQDRAFAVVSEKNPNLAEPQRRDIARRVGIAAVKYADLSKNRVGDYIFSWDHMLAFDGNTAPYLLYAFARVRSIFRRGDMQFTPGAAAIQIIEPSERKLALLLLRFHETIEQVAQDGFPNGLCAYLYDIAGSFMQFYEACPVLKADEPVRGSRLALSHLCAETLKTGLELLGITTIEQM